jgi:amidase
VTAAEYLLAVEDVQRYSRRLAAFLTGFDLFLSPTLATPPLPLGEMTSTPDDPLRALRNGGPTVAYSGVIANLSGNPAMSVPLWWNAEGLPIGVHFLGRFGDEATLFRLASQLEHARPWAGRVPPTHASTVA